VDEPTWTFARGAERLEISRRDGDGQAVLTIVGADGARSYNFRTLVALTNFQCDMEELLLKTGWSFVQFSPNQRTGRERRRAPRILGDRRRWWTDEPTPLPATINPHGRKS
jgi:hypothetical protein